VVEITEGAYRKLERSRAVAVGGRLGAGPERERLQRAP
jgi:hypothetical protein